MHRTLAAMLLVVAAAGCIQASEPAAQVDPGHPMAQSDFTWDPEFPLVGQPVAFDPSIRSGVPGNSIDRLIWDMGAVQLVEDRPVHTFDTPGQQRVTLTIETTKATPYTVEHTLFIRASADEPIPETPTGNETPPPPPPVLPPKTFECPSGLVNETYISHGSGDPQIPDMSWAVLKTGFRAVIVAEGDGAATLTYAIGKGAEQTETSTSGPHVFVLDNLPEGKTLCFQLDNGQTSEWHAMHLGNAMTSYDEVYTVNLLIMANERTNMAVLEDAVGRYAERLYDATDGHIRSGAVIVVRDHYERQQEAHQPCWNGNPGLHVSVFTGILCDRHYDVIFTHNVHPLAAGATYLDGIQDPDITMWMNAVHEAGITSSGNGAANEVGAVLLHELGHYMLGAQDLYPEGGITTSDCYVSSSKISIMGGSRSARELDGEDAPCPTASSAYKPTWQQMTARFDMIPDRVGGTVFGPDGDGGAFVYHQITIGL